MSCLKCSAIWEVPINDLWHLIKYAWEKNTVVLFFVFFDAKLKGQRSAGFHDNWVASTKKLVEDESLASAGRLLSSLPLEMLKGQTGFFVN